MKQVSLKESLIAFLEMPQGNVKQLGPIFSCSKIVLHGSHKNLSGGGAHPIPQLGSGGGTPGVRDGEQPEASGGSSIYQLMSTYQHQDFPSSVKA